MSRAPTQMPRRHSVRVGHSITAQAFAKVLRLADVKDHITGIAHEIDPGAFGQLADSPNQKIIMLPIEAMSILSSLAGIGEIAKATFGESAASAQAAARRGSVPSAGSPPPQR